LPYPYAASPRTTTSLFFIAPAPTQIYTLSLHDALPISMWGRVSRPVQRSEAPQELPAADDDTEFNPLTLDFGDTEATEESRGGGDRKSTRLNSSHVAISYAVFCLKKKINGCTT